MPAGESVPELFFQNSGFEDGLNGWSVDMSRGGEISVVEVGFEDSRYALRIKAGSEKNGARIDSPLVPCQGVDLIEFYGSVQSVSGRSLGLWGNSMDAEGRLLPDEFWTCIEAEDGVWRRHSLIGVITPHPRAAFLQLSLIAYPSGKEKIEACFDDFQLVVPVKKIPPGPGTYSLRPGEEERLTPADFPGPDGIVYPDWTRAGVDGGIPELPAFTVPGSMEFQPGTDISDAVERAAAGMSAAGGGTVVIGPGTFYLDRPVTIRHSRIVLRGAGRDRTRLVFRYSTVDPNPRMPERDIGAVITFEGSMQEREYRLSADGRRGDMVIYLRPGHDLKAGDKVMIRAPDTERWQAEVNFRALPPVDPTHAYHIWARRTNMCEITEAREDRVFINEPLRIDYPEADASFVRRVVPVEFCGIENLSIQHECRMEFHTLTTRFAWNCWVRGVDCVDCGRSGVHFQAAKHCEIRDCTFTGFDPAVHKAHVNWGGYAGFTHACDCLMDNTAWHRFRHGPCVQFGAQGNVIRNSSFHGSDAQWHAGWATENLFENCTIDARGDYGSYGYGAYATGSYDGTHGPNGPRNVVYNCDFISDRSGLMINGFNENWIFAHNRFTVGKGAGLTVACASFNNIVRSNVFVLKDPAYPMVQLLTADCTGNEVQGNILAGGNGLIAEGRTAAAVEKNNTARPLNAAAPGRPEPEPFSIFEWQKEKKHV